MKSSIKQSFQATESVQEIEEESVRTKELRIKEVDLNSIKRRIDKVLQIDQNSKHKTRKNRHGDINKIISNFDENFKNLTDRRHAEKGHAKKKHSQKSISSKKQCTNKVEEGYQKLEEVLKKE